MAIMNGETGPRFSHSESVFDKTPARMANIPFQKVASENMTEIHSVGNPRFSMCSHTYQDSNVENRSDVDIPPRMRPENKNQNESYIN